MKKIIFFALTFLFLLWLLPACTNGTGEPDKPNEGKTETETDGFAFIYKDESVHMGEDMQDVLTKWGEPRKMFETQSCAFEGMDRIFSYPGFEVHTYPDGDKDFVQVINFKDDSIATPEGVYLGSSLSDMLAAYGGNYQQELSQYTYEKGTAQLSFIIEDGVVEAIKYELKM